MLISQGNLACTYEKAGRLDEALSLRQEVYSGRLKLNGEEDQSTITAANNYADSLRLLKRFEEAKALLRKWIPKARRVLGEGHRLTLKMRWIYAQSLYEDNGATLDDLREAVTTLEETERIARRVFGVTNPMTRGIENPLEDARAALRARETPSPAGNA
jgi:tetratricopeptide (TPR) repeat protein